GELRNSGVFVYDSVANFLLIQASSDFAERMKQRGILIRKCEDFHGLTDAHFRIAVRTHDENLALISAIREEYK
nr:threonine-phosphate decarboxylase [Oscillospiraceae bacterium]